MKSRIKEEILIAVREEMQKLASEGCTIKVMTDPDDILETANLSNYQSAIWNIKQEVRKKWKYSEFEHNETSEAVDEIYSFICDELNERGIGGEF